LRFEEDENHVATVGNQNDGVAEIAASEHVRPCTSVRPCWTRCTSCYSEAESLPPFSFETPHSATYFFKITQYNVWHSQSLNRVKMHLCVHHAVPKLNYVTTQTGMCIRGRGSFAVQSPQLSGLHVGSTTVGPTCQWANCRGHNCRGSHSCIGYRLVQHERGRDNQI
jgi:hypothetical protein